ncbi:MAG: hypothetical protein ACKOFU_01620 [Actinomycetota bacterium]
MTSCSAPEGTIRSPSKRKQFDFPIALGVAAFSLLSALAHLWIVGPGFKGYSEDLRNQRNIARWIEYSISSTLMIVLISLINPGVLATSSL